MPHQELVINGEKWPSATELTKLLPQPWLWNWYARSVEKYGWAGWQANKKKADEGMALGTEVHRCLDFWIDGESTDVSAEAGRLAEMLWAKVNPTVCKWMYGDIHLKHPKLKIHGAADAIVQKVNTEVLTVGDFKTSYQKDISHPIQLCVYAMCWNFEKSDKINRGEIWRIDKKTKKVAIDKYNNLKQYEPVVKALRTIWGYVNA